MTDEPIIDKLERLEREATPGPWEVYETQGGEYLIRGGVDCSEGCCRSIIVYDGPTEAEAHFIVSMRNALPSLLSQLREQRERAERAEAELVIASRVVERHLPSAVESAKRDGDLAESERTVREQRGHIVGALRELGIAGPGYPAPVANAIAILTAALDGEG